MFGFGKSKKDGDKKSDQPFYTISAEKAKERMQSTPAPIIVDVRTKGEYEQAHIPSAILFRTKLSVRSVQNSFPI